MIGASTAIGVAGSVYPPAGHNNSHLSQNTNHVPRKPADAEGRGALASAADALSRSLGSSGFLDIAASFNESFTRCLHYQPVEKEFGNLNPGAMREVMALVTRKIMADPKQALAAQAHVPGPAAVRLLK